MPSQTFSSTGAVQTFTVPAGVTSVTVDAQGAQGGGSNGVVSSLGGKGGRVQCDIAVTPAEVLQVNVGAQGQTKTSSNGSAGGWNGGGNGDGNGDTSNNYGGGGGGASDIRRVSSPTWSTNQATQTGLPSTYGFTAGGSAPTGWSVASGELAIVTSTVNYYQINGPGNSGDRTLEFEVRVAGNPGGSGVNQTYGQWFTIGNQTRFIDLGIFNNILKINDNGTDFTIGTLPVADFNSYRKIRLVMEGTLLSVFVDDVLVYTRTIVRTFSSDSISFGQGTGASSGNWHVRALRIAYAAYYPDYALQYRLVVAPGGGGVGANDQKSNASGFGGTPNGGVGATGNGSTPGVGGGGGTSSAGGAGGSGSSGTGANGALGVGGAARQDALGRGGGGGGGGRYGGGGGGMAASGSSGGGGGGGSGLSTGVNQTITDDYKTGEGLLTITWASTMKSKIGIPI